MKRFFFLMGFFAMFAFSAAAQTFVTPGEAVRKLSVHVVELQKNPVANLGDSADPANTNYAIHSLKIAIGQLLAKNIERSNSVAQGLSQTYAESFLNPADPKRAQMVNQVKTYFTEFLSK